MEKAKFIIRRIDGARLLSRVLIHKIKNEDVFLDEKQSRNSFIHALERQDKQDDCDLLQQLLVEKIYRGLSGKSEYDPSIFDEGNVNEEAAVAMAQQKKEQSLEKLDPEERPLKDIKDLLVYVVFQRQGKPYSNVLADKSARDSFNYLIAHGFSMYLEDENKNLVLHHFVPFLRSGSMAKAKTISFIDENYEEALYQRILLGWAKPGSVPGLKDPKSLSITRFHAYTGLALSGGYEVPGIIVDEKHIVVVPEHPGLVKRASYMTEVSLSDLYNLLESAFIYYAYSVGVSFPAETLNSMCLPKKNDCRSRGEGDFFFSKACKDIANVLGSTDAAKVKDFVVAKSAAFEQGGIKAVKDEFLPYFDLSEIRFNKEKHIALLTSTHPEVSPFDGEGFISKEAAEIIRSQVKRSRANGKQHHTFQIRMPLIKGMVHECDFLSFFKNHQDAFVDVRGIGAGHFNTRKQLINAGVGKTPEAILDLDGMKIVDAFDRYRRVDDPENHVQMILTTGQFKLKKILTYDKNSEGDFFAEYLRRARKAGRQLFVTSFDSIDKEHDGILKLNSQFLSTSGLSEADLKTLLAREKENLDRLSKLKDGHTTLLAEEAESLDDSENEDDYQDDVSIYSGLDNDVIAAIKKNPDCADYAFIGKAVREHILGKANDCGIGHIHVPGEIRFLSGDLLALLYIIIGKEKEYSELPERLGINSFYAPSDHADLFPKEEGLGYVLMRNPHVAKNENGYAEPYVPTGENDEREHYFHHLQGVCMINPYSLIQERLGGADYDGDRVAIVSDRKFREAVKKQYHLFEGSMTPNYYTVKIPHLPDCQRELNRTIVSHNFICFDDCELANTLVSTFVNRVGTFSNQGYKFAALENALAMTGEDEALRNDAAIKTVLYLITIGLEIDAAKSGTSPEEPSDFEHELSGSPKAIRQMASAALSCMSKVRHPKYKDERLLSPSLNGGDCASLVPLAIVENAFCASSIPLPNIDVKRDINELLAYPVDKSILARVKPETVDAIFKEEVKSRAHRYIDSEKAPETIQGDALKRREDLVRSILFVQYGDEGDDISSDLIECAESLTHYDDVVCDDWGSISEDEKRFRLETAGFDQDDLIEVLSSLHARSPMLAQAIGDYKRIFHKEFASKPMERDEDNEYLAIGNPKEKNRMLRKTIDDLLKNDGFNDKEIFDIIYCLTQEGNHPRFSLVKFGELFAKEFVNRLKEVPNNAQ